MPNKAEEREKLRHMQRQKILIVVHDQKFIMKVYILQLRSVKKL